MNRKHSIELIESIIDTKNVIQIEITEIGTKTLTNDELTMHDRTDLLVKEIIGVPPLFFSTNAHWNLSYQCLKCNSKISVDPWPLPQAIGENRLGLLSLATSYYSIDMLEFLAFTLNGLHCIDAKMPDGKNITVVGNPEGFDKNYPISSSPTVAYTECCKCKSEYLINFKYHFPHIPSKDFNIGILGRGGIHEIILVEMRESSMLRKIIQNGMM